MDQPTPSSRRQLSWTRLAAGTAATFAVVLAFLAGRVHGGADPALGRSAAAPAEPGATDTGRGTDPGIAPGTGSAPNDAQPYGGTPDQGAYGAGPGQTAPGGAPDDGAAGGDPPATHAS